MNKKILIVGLGLIGGSYAKRLSKKDYLVYGYDLNKQTITKAYEENVIQNKTIDDLSFFKNVDIVVLSLYPEDNVKFLKQYQNYFQKGTIITDTTGIKTKIITEILIFIRKDLILIPSHPMAGKEVSGYDNSDPNLFLDANFIITKIRDEDITPIYKMAEDLGFLNIEVLSIQAHDEIISFLSQLTHIIAVALMNTHDAESYINYTGDSFRDLTRIAKINENLWSELFLSNQTILLKEIDDFKKALNDVEEKIINQDLDGLKEIMIKSKKARILFDQRNHSK